jgi:hypothetical protein
MKEILGLVLTDKEARSSITCSCLSVSTVLGSQEMLTSAIIVPTGMESHALNALEIVSLCARGDLSPVH